MNDFAQQSLVDHVTSQSDYTGFAKAVENIPSFDEPNIHGSGHFAMGGVRDVGKRGAESGWWAGLSRRCTAGESM
ncbi:hypothetical protein EYZ11_005772 [Aspergillus tanneri]|uniref:Uncharacterized protein n=1 Tax=Aspergillus tanneri TaxID=1220188 RepID=A0A4S3JH90_9EURO|nr:hypothetical protein EYZ11_005772 [Aspergillus tanneri]